MPNWPRKSCRAKPSSSRLELRPMVASSSCTCASVSPMPVSCTRRRAVAGRVRRLDADPRRRVRLGRPPRGDRVDGVLQQLAHVDAGAARRGGG